MAVTIGSFNTADLIVAAIILIVMLFGVVRGFANSIAGGAGSLIVIALGIVGIIFLKEYVQEQSVYLQLKDKIAELITKFSESLTYPAKVEDGIIVVSTDDGWVKLTETLTGTKSILAGLLQKIVIKYAESQLDGTLSIVQIITAKAADISLIAIMFVVITIISKILFSIFAKLANDIMKDNPTLIKLDRVLGLVLSAALIAVIMLGSFYYIAKHQDKFVSIVQAIEQSYVVKWIYLYNPMLTWLP